MPRNNKRLLYSSATTNKLYVIVIDGLLMLDHNKQLIAYPFKKNAEQVVKYIKKADSRWDRKRNVEVAVYSVLQKKQLNKIKKICQQKNKK